MAQFEGPAIERARMTKTVYRRRSIFYRIFRENIGLKILSIASTLVLFFIVKEDKGQEADIEIPVVLSAVSEDYVFVGEIPRSIRVRVRGRSSRLAQILERKANPYLVDLRGFSDQTVYVFDAERVRQILGGAKITVQSIYPSEFVVRLEGKMERVVPVRPTIVGEVPDGYLLQTKDIEVRPPQVHIWGAKSSVMEVKELVTYPINVSNVDKDTQISVKIQKPALPSLYIDEDQVTVHIPVQVLHGRLALEDQDVVISGCPSGFACTAEPSRVSITLIGPKPALLQVERNLTPVEAVVEVGDLEPGAGRYARIPLTCRRPSGLDCRLSPRFVTVRISNREEEGPEVRSSH